MRSCNGVKTAHIDTAIALAAAALVLFFLSNAYPLVVINYNGTTRSATLLDAAAGALRPRSCRSRLAGIHHHRTGSLAADRNSPVRFDSIAPQTAGTGPEHGIPIAHPDPALDLCRGVHAWESGGLGALVGVRRGDDRSLLVVMRIAHVDAGGADHPYLPCSVLALGRAEPA